MISTDYANLIESNRNDYEKKLKNIETISPTSIPKRKLEMKITIFNLDRLREFRRSELTATVNLNSQLFSFDGLLSNTWFAIRINYRLLYYDVNEYEGKDSGTSTSNNDVWNFPTKQELIVKTREENSPPLLLSSTSNNLFNENLITFNEIITSHNHLNITLNSVLSSKPKITTLIVPELRCLRGTIKPPAQRVLSSKITVNFDLSKLAKLNNNGFFSSDNSILSYQHNKSQNGHNKALNHRRHYYSTKASNDDNLSLSIAANQPNEFNSVDLKQLNKLQCYQICMFPFVRAEILDYGEQTFRAKEFCDTVQQMQRLIIQTHHEQPRQQRLRSTFKSNIKEQTFPSCSSSIQMIPLILILLLYFLIFNLIFFLNNL